MILLLTRGVPSQLYATHILSYSRRIVANTDYCVRFDASSHHTPVFMWTGASWLLLADRRSALRMGAGKYSSHVHKDLARRSRALPLILSLRIEHVLSRSCYTCASLLLPIALSDRSRAPRAAAVTSPSQDGRARAEELGTALEVRHQIRHKTAGHERRSSGRRSRSCTYAK